MDAAELYLAIENATGLDRSQIPEIPRELEPLVNTLLQRLSAENQQKTEAESLLAFFKSSADAMPNPIFIKDENLRFVFFNRAYRTFFGLKEGENIGKQVKELLYLPEEDRRRYHEEDQEGVRSLSVIQYPTAYQDTSQGKVEALYWSKGFQVPETGRRGLVGEIVNISREREVQRELEEMVQDARDASNTDPLTKLNNRNVMDVELPAMIQDTAASGMPVCLMLIDIDYFKQINDEHGHLFADEMLRQFSQVLKMSFRQNDMAVRYGGDEFLILLPGAELHQARTVAERFRDAVRENLRLPGGQGVTLSIGVAQWRAGDDLKAFISRADEALYESKRAGRDRVSVKE